MKDGQTSGPPAPMLTMFDLLESLRKVREATPPTYAEKARMSQRTYEDLKAKAKAMLVNLDYTAAPESRLESPDTFYGLRIEIDPTVPAGTIKLE